MLYVIKLPPGLTVEEALSRYSALPSIAYAEPNYRVQAYQTYPDDPYFSSLWGLHNTGYWGDVDADIDAPEAWEIRTDASAITVAVIDTGIQVSHADLAANIWVNSGEVPGNGIDDDWNGYVDDVNGWDFYNRDGTVYDGTFDDHGTHVAGTIGGVGNNGTGVSGVTWQVQLMSLKFLDPEGYGDIADAIEAINYAADNGADVINASWGLQSYTPPASLCETIEASGVLFVAAAGNGGTDGIGDNNDSLPHWPSNCSSDNVIAVAASDYDDELTYFSNYGATSVDLAAPGSQIWSTWPYSTYYAANGTSMAAPHVTGAAALLMAQYRTFAPFPGAPGLNPSIKEILLTTVDQKSAFVGSTVSGGRLNLDRAIRYLDAPTVTVLSPSGGDVWTGTHTIRWSATDPTYTSSQLTITIEYSLDGGTSWTMLVDDLPGSSSSYPWRVSSLGHGSAESQVRVTVTNPESISGYGVSDLFTIGRTVGTMGVGPNPARSSATFYLNAPSGGVLRVFNVRGNEVFQTSISPGQTSFRWDLTDSTGKPLANGIYLFTLTGNEGSSEAATLVIER